MNVAILGAAGNIGARLLEHLPKLPVTKLRLFAGPEHLGKVAHFKNTPIRFEGLTDAAVEGSQLVFNFTDDATFVPKFVKAGATVIDHSTVSRMDPSIPSVVVGVNSHEVRNHRGIVATPNCATVQLALALKPLHDAFTLRRVVVTTLQAVSGAGATAEMEFEDETRSLIFDDRVFKREIFPKQLSMNVIPRIGAIREDGSTVEEFETAEEIRRLFRANVTATCLRVPVKNAHAESVTVEFEKPVTRASAIRVLREASGLSVAEDEIPTPAEVSGRGEVYIGRIRQDGTVPSGLSLWVVADNLLRGTALNALGIAEILVKQ